MVIHLVGLVGIIGNTQKKVVVHLGVVIKILMAPIYVFILEVINSSFNLKGMTNETGVPNRIIIVDRYRPNQPAPPNDPYPYCEEAAQKISTLLLWRDEKNVFI